MPKYFFRIGYPNLPAMIPDIFMASVKRNQDLIDKKFQAICWLHVITYFSNQRFISFLFCEYRPEMAIEVFEVTDTQSVQQPSHFLVYSPCSWSSIFYRISDPRISPMARSLPRSLSILNIRNAISSSVDEIITFTRFVYRKIPYHKPFCSNALYITVFYQSR